jgi:type III secretion protein V
MNALIVLINGFAQKAARRAELAAAGLVIAIVFMLVLPMPIWLLDMLIAVNLCASGLIVVVSMYMKSATAFSTFPAVLLLTTLFRLAIEVATTRLILLEADAGHIVETFGNFVVGGNIVVGLVVFLILTVVQFIVITKGSERVSEVTARFTLDAMPGKQMSIDSDLRAGLISAEDAMSKRSELQRESQMHGAMDGAMKFVKGDAIAGIFIVGINLIGGIAIGVMQRGMVVSEAVQVYSVLTIGDALIAQIPGLLISLTAGMITTRVADDDHKDEPDEGGPMRPTNVGQHIVKELFSEPKALVTAGVIMVIFALIPGMPWPVFLFLAALLISGGVVGLKVPGILKELKAASEKQSAVAPKLEDVRNFKATRPMQLVMSKALENDPAGEALVRSMRLMRNSLLNTRGYPDFPLVDLVFDVTMPSDRFEFRIVEVPMVQARVRHGWGCTGEKPQRLDSLGFSYEIEDVEGSRRKRCWIELSRAADYSDAGVAWEPWELVMASDMESEMLRHSSNFLGIQEMSRFQKFADNFLPELGRELTKALPLPRVAEVFQKLAREGISLRNVRLLLETLYDWSQKERDPDVICEHLRLALRRQICHQIARDGLIQAVLLSPDLEEVLRSSVRRSSAGEWLDLEPEIEQRLLDQLATMVGTGATLRHAPAVVTTADLRRQLRRLIEEEFFPVPVLAFTELSQHYRVQPIGVVEL